MAMQDMVISDRHVEQQLEVAKRLIKEKNYPKAKMILNDLEHPTALRWREKLEEIDMLAEKTAASRPKLKAVPKSNLLADVTGVFLDHDWTISTQIGSTVVMEKKKPLSSLAAAAITVFFGLVGMVIALIVTANARFERITLSQAEDGSILFSDSKYDELVIRDPQEVVEMAQSIKKGVSYAALLTLGVGVTIVWAVLLH